MYLHRQKVRNGDHILVEVSPVTHTTPLTLHLRYTYTFDMSLKIYPSEIYDAMNALLDFAGECVDAGWVDNNDEAFRDLLTLVRDVEPPEGYDDFDNDEEPDEERSRKNRLLTVYNNIFYVLKEDLNWSNLPDVSPPNEDADIDTLLAEFEDATSGYISRLAKIIAPISSIRHV